MALEFVSVTDFGVARAAEVLSRAFADYYVPIASNTAILLQMARADSVDLAVSRVFIQEGAAVGAALIARRGWTSRLAGMAIVPEARRTGLGREGVMQLLAEAKSRGERQMVLEVIEQNEPAVRLYEHCGFNRVRRLVGFVGPGKVESPVPAELQEVNLRDLAAIVTQNGWPDLPWQLSGETLAQLTPPAVAYRLDRSWVALAGTAGPQVTIRGLVTETDAQGRGGAARLLRAVMGMFPGKEWRIPAIWPEELGSAVLEVGLARTPLSQWQMERAC